MGKLRLRELHSGLRSCWVFPSPPLNSGKVAGGSTTGPLFLPFIEKGTEAQETKDPRQRQDPGLVAYQVDGKVSKGKAPSTHPSSGPLPQTPLLLPSLCFMTCFMSMA